MLALRKTVDAAGLALVDVAEPPQPGPGQVMIDVIATGICGSDLSIDSWSASYSGFMRGVLPVTLGHETAGRVSAAGPGVNSPAVGDIVVVNPAVACGRCAACRAGDLVGCTDRQAIGMVTEGAFARRFLAPADYCYHLPDTVPPELGALVEPLSVGAHALAVGAMSRGKRVIVFGPGPIGQGVAALAQKMGAADIVIVGKDDDARFATLRHMGFDKLVDMSASDAGEQLAALAGSGFDLAIEAAGVAPVVPLALSLLGQQGILVLAGMSEAPATVDLMRIVRFRLQIRGASRIPPSIWPEVIEQIAGDPDFFGKLVSHRLPLAEAGAAFELCRSKTASKVLLLP